MDKPIWINGKLINKEEWLTVVKEGSTKQTIRRLHYHNLLAANEVKERKAKEIDAAYQIRELEIKKQNEEKRKIPIVANRVLTLEEYGKLYVLNVPGYPAFEYWRTVRCRGKTKIENK